MSWRSFVPLYGAQTSPSSVIALFVTSELKGFKLFKIFKKQDNIFNSKAQPKVL